MSQHNLGGVGPYYPTPGLPTPDAYHQAQVSQAAQAVAGMQAGAQVMPSGLLQQAREAVLVCHSMLNDLHKFADQYVGIRGEEKPGSAPSPVPNGQAEELRDAIMQLQARIRLLCDRLSVL